MRADQQDRLIFWLIDLPYAYCKHDPKHAAREVLLSSKPFGQREATLHALQWFTWGQLKGPAIECSSWVGNQWVEKCGIEPGTGMAEQCGTTPTPYVHLSSKDLQKTLKPAQAHFLS